MSFGANQEKNIWFSESFGFQNFRFGIVALKIIIQGMLCFRRREIGPGPH